MTFRPKIRTQPNVDNKIIMRNLITFSDYLHLDSVLYNIIQYTKHVIKIMVHHPPRPCPPPPKKNILNFAVYLFNCMQT